MTELLVRTDKVLYGLRAAILLIIINLCISVVLQYNNYYSHTGIGLIMLCMWYSTIKSINNY